MTPLWNKSANVLIKEYGHDWKLIIGLPTSRPKNLKAKIYKFDDFPEKTKEVYIKIYRAILSCTNYEFKLWAVGSRVNGCWRTEEEELVIYKECNLPIKYSDYDYITTGNIPDNDIIVSLGLDPSIIDGIKINTDQLDSTSLYNNIMKILIDPIDIRSKNEY